MMTCVSETPTEEKSFVMIALTSRLMRSHRDGRFLVYKLLSAGRGKAKSIKSIRR